MTTASAAAAKRAASRDNAKASAQTVPAAPAGARVAQPRGRSKGTQPPQARRPGRFKDQDFRPAPRVPTAVPAPARAPVQKKARPTPAPVPWRTRLAAPAGFALAAAALYVGWRYRDQHLISAESGLGYALGIVSVACMMTLLIYPLRKRLRFLGFLGSIRNWFRTHQQLGVLAPIAALYHCNFELGSLNSRIALYCALIVAGSGLIGRFLYRRLNRSVSGRRTDLKQVRAALAAEQFPRNRALTFLPLMRQRVHRFDQGVIDAGTGLWSSLRMSLGLARQARRERKVLMHFCESQLAKESQGDQLIGAHQRRLAKSMDRYLAGHMRRLRLLATLQAYERLFALWHIVHLPFFVLLLISVVVHVFAVHLY